jgi:NAD(P)-dependent dehydrogenase (short-subunit alcohol dehydrogenase family)
MSLQNQVLLVTGANRGIGKAIVAGAIQRGATKVYAAVRSLDSGAALVEEFGPRVVTIHFDLESPPSILEAARAASDVNAVIHNAGVFHGAGALAENAVATLESQINVNASGLLRVAQAFAPVLKANGGGSLVQLNSVASIKSFAQGATYAASKAASYILTQSLREELAKQGTHVVSVHPGPIATDMAREGGMYEQGESPSVVADAIFVALEEKTFHVFPDSLAQQFWLAYSSYAQAFVEPLELVEAR